MAPTVIINMKTNIEYYKEEIFSPILACTSVQTLEEAVQLLNLNEYGNGVSIFTKLGSSTVYF